MRPVPPHPSVLARIVEIALFVSLGAGQAFATTQTTTTLSVGPSNNVTAGAVVILTATVTNPSAVTKGTVKFCNALITDCGPGRGLYGTAALTSAGTAVLRTRLGVGVTNIQASFLATTANAASTSLTNTVAVSASPIYSSSTNLSASGGVGNYTLGGVVTGFGSQPLTGSLSFLDSTNGNDQIGTGSLNAATSSFANQVSYASGAAYTVAAGDFNGDGIPDLAVANNNGSASPGSVSVLLGNGDGTFKAPVPYAAGSEAMSLAVGDLNGDGILDLVVVNHNSATVSVFLGNGDGTFQSQVTYATGSGPMSAAVGDFNGDGIPDLAVTNMWGGTVSVLLGNGDGTFRTQVVYATGIYPVSVAVGDFNGDGILDLAITNSGSGTISVFLGNGDGSFQSQITYATGFGGESVAVGDFNGDGILDLAIANDSAGTVSVLLGKGDGSFQSQVTYATGITPMSVAVGDFNGDGIPDLAISNESSSTVSILLGKGDGTFQSQVSYATGAYPYSVAVGDFNGDGIPDLAVANAGAGTVSALLGSQVAAFSVNGVSVPGSGTHNIFASYGGDASRAVSQSSTVPLTAFSKTTPIVTVSCSPSVLTYGPQNSTCTASVGGGATGTVAFAWNGNAWSTPTLSGGVAAATGFAGIPVGTYTVSVVYGGDSNNNTASASTTLTITKATLTVTLTTPSNPASYGTSVTFTAQVAASATGTITFLDGATSIGSGTVSGGIATFTTTSLAAGTHNITASYSGDANYSAAVSALLPEAIAKASATVNMTSSFSPSTYGQSVTFTFTATGVLGTPSGTVAISDGATLLATPTLNASGVATFTTANLTVGSHNLTAVYGGDANYK